MTECTLRVIEIASRCLTEEAGKKFLRVLKPHLDQGSVVILDFSDITMFASLFFNNSLAQLLKDFDPEFVNSHLKLTNLSDAGRKTVTRSMENAASFFNLDDEGRRKVISIVDAASNT